MQSTWKIGARGVGSVVLLIVVMFVSYPGNTEVRLRSPQGDGAVSEQPLPRESVRMGPNIVEELRCLALNIYFEARSETKQGQIAVAMVTLNRTAHRKFPDTICGVVRQGGHNQRNRCQFSWYCDGKRDVPANRKAWQKSQEIARLVVSAQLADPTGGALWYHADYVRPKWSRALRRTTRIGRHVYYTQG